MHKLRAIAVVPQAESKAISNLQVAIETGNVESVKNLLVKIDGENLGRLKLDPHISIAMQSMLKTSQAFKPGAGKHFDQACALVLATMTQHDLPHKLDQATVLKMVHAGASDSIVKVMESGFQVQPSPSWPMARVMEESRKTSNGIERVIDAFLAKRAVQHYLEDRAKLRPVVSLAG